MVEFRLHDFRAIFMILGVHLVLGTCLNEVLGQILDFSSEVGCLNLALNQSDDFYMKFGGNLWLGFVRTIFVRKKVISSAQNDS